MSPGIRPVADFDGSYSSTPRLMKIEELDWTTLHANYMRGASWCTTFAYWLGVLFDRESGFAKSAEAAQNAMSYQHDVEEQAYELDHLRGDEELIPSIFMPVAPVTLALEWSPFPAIGSALGEPVFSDSGNYSKVSAAFHPAVDPSFAASSDDERHFLRLLRGASVRAAEQDALVFMVGSPGWSYKSRDHIASDDQLRELMSEFGFVATVRHP